MASYRISLKRSAEKDLQRLSPEVASRIVNAIDSLGSDPRPRGYAQLKGQRDRCRIRIGDYRVLYSIDDRNHEVTVSGIGHRREAYRKR